MCGGDRCSTPLAEAVLILGRGIVGQLELSVQRPEAVLQAPGPVVSQLVEASFHCRKFQYSLHWAVSLKRGVSTGDRAT
eukprot:4994068-Pleurochrysis_carterae.AAC.8